MYLLCKYTNLKDTAGQSATTGQDLKTPRKKDPFDNATSWSNWLIQSELIDRSGKAVFVFFFVLPLFLLLEIKEDGVCPRLYLCLRLSQSIPIVGETEVDGVCLCIYLCLSPSQSIPIAGEIEEDGVCLCICLCLWHRLSQSIPIVGEIEEGGVCLRLYLYLCLSQSIPIVGEIEEGGVWRQS